MAHNTEAIEANTREQQAASDAVLRLAGSLDGLADRLAVRPCLREREHAALPHV